MDKYVERGFLPCAKSFVGAKIRRMYRLAPCSSFSSVDNPSVYPLLRGLEGISLLGFLSLACRYSLLLVTEGRAVILLVWWWGRIETGK